MLKPISEFEKESTLLLPQLRRCYYVTKPVHCLTLSQGGRADSDFGQQRANKQNLIRESIQKSRTNVIRITDRRGTCTR